MIDGQAIVSKAREYLNTPFHHQGRLKGVGVDCIGLVVGTAKELGLTTHDSTDYTRQPTGQELLRHLRGHTIPVLKDDAQIGDIVVFWVARRDKPQHIGFLTDKGIIHTYQGAERVVEHRLNEFWSVRVIHLFRFPGVAEGAKYVWPTPQGELEASYQRDEHGRFIEPGPCCE